jgi:hypothetical protein
MIGGMALYQSPIFWTAFWAGLAAPASLYAPPEPYYLYLSGSSVASSFGSVAMYLDNASGIYFDVGQTSVGPASPTA